MFIVILNLSHDTEKILLIVLLNYVNFVAELNPRWEMSVPKYNISVKI